MSSPARSNIYERPDEVGGHKKERSGRGRAQCVRPQHSHNDTNND